MPRIQQPPPVDVHYDYSLLEEVVASLDAGGQCDAESEQTSPHHSNDRSINIAITSVHKPHRLWISEEALGRNEWTCKCTHFVMGLF